MSDVENVIYEVDKRTLVKPGEANSEMYYMLGRGEDQ